MTYLTKMASLCFLFTSLAVTSSAAEICKSIDEDGNVTFADCQAVDSDSTRIEVREGPTEAEILAAKERAKREINAFDEIVGAPDSPATVSPTNAPLKTTPRIPVSGTKIRLSGEQLDAQQISLDKQCEIAREKVLRVERAQYVEECVQERRMSNREACERFYATHGAATATSPPLHLDLPECVEAYKFQRNRSGFSD